MSIHVIDTLKVVADLTASGMPEQQAKAVAKVQVEIADSQMDDSITKADLLAVKADLHEALEPIKKELESVKKDMHLTKWMLAIIFLVVVVPALKNFLA